MPSSTVTNGLGGAWEYRRGGYSLVLNGAWFARAAGSPGAADRRRRRRLDDPAADLREVQRRPVARLLSRRRSRRLHLNGALVRRQRSRSVRRYQFGLFDDTRIHGVPASGVRFGELAMARGSYSFNIFEQYRLDLFLDQAWGRDDRRVATGSRSPGSASAVNVRAPWNTILRADVGQELAAGALPAARLDRAADPAPEAARR